MAAADPDRRARLARIRATGAVVLIHPCAVCGAPHAPYGKGLDLKNKRLGTWYCAAHVPPGFLPKAAEPMLI